jgi:hypothetical protein
MLCLPRRTGACVPEPVHSGASGLVVAVVIAFPVLAVVVRNPLPLPSMGFLVGYATATGREAWAGEDSSQYSTALLCSMRASSPSATMTSVLVEASTVVPAHGKWGQTSPSYSNLGALGSVAFFHGVHGLLSVCESATGSPSPVRVMDVVGKLLDDYLNRVCTCKCRRRGPCVMAVCALMLSLT